ncbi:MAG: hypothetical protein PHF86_03295 [Candidatus Nanoarchaeia archaeon]|nr:hypothetical protein [Candidatus Nanoarchaeia archaeon]
MGHKPQEPDIFFLRTGYIECLSGTGHVYKVTHDSCSCKGFGFRKLCRHYRQAEAKGYLDQLETQIIKNPKFIKTEHIRKMRMDAIRVFLDKYNLKYQISQIVDLEKIVTVTTTKQDIFGFFF